MIVVYETPVDFIRIEDVKTIHIVDLEKEKDLILKRIEILKKQSHEIEQENVLLKDIVFDKIRRYYSVLISNKMYLEEGYKYFISILSTENFSFPIKKLGDPKLVDKLLNSQNKIEYIKILQDEGIVEIK